MYKIQSKCNSNNFVIRKWCQRFIVFDIAKGDFNRAVYYEHDIYWFLEFGKVEIYNLH